MHKTCDNADAMEDKLWSKNPSILQLVIFYMKQILKIKTPKCVFYSKSASSYN